MEVRQSRQANSRESADTDLQVVSFLDPALVNRKRVDFRLVDMAGSVRADVMTIDPTALGFG